MRVPTETTAATAPCLAHGGERIFSNACQTCAEFALGCFPQRPRPVTSEATPTPPEEVAK